MILRIGDIIDEGMCMQVAKTQIDTQGIRREVKKAGKSEKFDAEQKELYVKRKNIH